MITIERHGWKVSRRLGVGDREHVRAGLLQVWCMDTTAVDTQVAASLAAAKKLGKTARIYINALKLRETNPSLLTHIIMVTMGQSRDHDIMEEVDFSDRHATWIIGRCDIIISPLAGGGDRDVLRDAIMHVWTTTGGREILGDNHGGLSENELRERFPQFYGGEDELKSLLGDAV